MTSLSKNVKPHFIANPMDLLETRASILLDGRSYVESYQQHAHELFESPRQGVYMPWETKPLFTIYEELFTHRDTHEYFPEIAEPVFNDIGVVMNAQRQGIHKKFQVAQTVGKRIDWRDAVNQQVNVYNKQGRLLLNHRQDRNRLKLVFNPGPEVFALKFLVDLVEMIVLEATCWGDATQVKIKMQSYMSKNLSFDQTLRNAIEIHENFFLQIAEYVRQDPWAIYKVNSLGSSIMVDKACDYRHFKCNEMLVEQMKVEQPDSDVIDTFATVNKMPQVRYEDLESLYQKLFDSTGHRVTSIPDLFELLGKTKNNQHMTSQVLLVFEDYLSDANNKSSLASEFVGKLTSRSFIAKVLEKQDGISSTDFAGGAGIYIL